MDGVEGGLVELAYALKAAGVIGCGQTPLNVIVDRLERAFHVRVDNPPRVFQEILYRKKGYTVFIDLLKGGLLAFIDENEDRHGEKARKAS